VPFDKDKQKPGVWNAGGKPMRVSDDGKMAVREDSYIGSQKFYADASLISGFSAALRGKSSAIRLIPGSESASGPSPKDPKSNVTLTQVLPRNVENDTQGDDMEMPADCGKAAGKVMGAGRGPNSNAREASFTDERGKQDKAGGDPQEMKWTVLSGHLMKENGTDGKPVFGATEMAQVNQLRRDADAVLQLVYAEKDKPKRDALLVRYSGIKNTIDRIFTTSLQKLTPQKRDQISKEAGINEYAAPAIGDAYVVSSGGDPKKDAKGKPIMTWNFHWGGVVGQSGGDNVTLENYATGVPDEQNKDWAFQMYGAVSNGGDKPKDGQSFHEQTRDVNQQHGEMPSTMSVGPKAK
jgi:hypothetical protein